MKLLLIPVREKGLYIVKTDCSDKMVVGFTTKEKSYLLVSVFFNLVLPLSKFSFTNCYGNGFMLIFLKLGILLQCRKVRT